MSLQHQYYAREADGRLTKVVSDSQWVNPQGQNHGVAPKPATGVGNVKTPPSQPKVQSKKLSDDVRKQIDAAKKAASNKKTASNKKSKENTKTIKGL